jgi:hypothetical protein
MAERPNHLHTQGQNPDSNPRNCVESYFHAALLVQCAIVKTSLKFAMDESLKAFCRRARQAVASRSGGRRHLSICADMRSKMSAHAALWLAKAARI